MALQLGRAPRAFDLSIPHLSVLLQMPEVVRPAVPDKFDWAEHLPTDMGMMLNDRYGCHSADTEVLTDRGWQLWPDYDGRDKLATMNPISGLMEFQAPDACTRFEYKGPMYFGAGKHVDFALTPEHRMFCRPYAIPYPYEAGGSGYGPPEFVRMKDLPNRVALPAAPTGFLGTHLRSIVIGNRTWDGSDFMALLGLVVSDGYARHEGAGSQNQIGFCCFDERQAEVRDLASRLGIGEQPSRPGVWLYSDGALADWIRSKCYVSKELGAINKCVPDLVKVASVDQIRQFIKFFGDQTDNSLRWQFYSSSRSLIDDLQDICLRIGYRGTIKQREPRRAVAGDGRTFQTRHPSFTMTMRRVKPHVVLQRLERSPSYELDQYSGEVFCATVPNSTLITRRNGVPLISGNCCVWSEAYHAIQVWSRDSRGVEITEPDKYVQQAYTEVTGFNPADVNTDQGTVMQDAMRYKATIGLPIAASPPGSTRTRHKSLGFAEVDPRHLDDVGLAAYAFGIAPIGFVVPAYLMESTPPQVWDVSKSGDQHSVGGHCVGITGVDKPRGLFNIVSWGLHNYQMSFEFFEKYCDEIYAEADPTWITTGGRTPLGLTAAQLTALLAPIRKH